MKAPTTFRPGATQTVAVGASSAASSALALPVGGLRNRSGGTIASEGLSGYYWAGEQGSSTDGRNIRIRSTTVATSSDTKSYGMLVRCIKD